MNAVMKPEQRIVSELIKKFDAAESAKQFLRAANAEQKAAWDDILERHSRTYGDDWLISWPLTEMVIVRDGAFTYEIKFNYDEWGLPSIRRVDDYISLMDAKDWS